MITSFSSKKTLRKGIDVLSEEEAKALIEVLIELRKLKGGAREVSKEVKDVKGDM
jgi:hypothetical protein